MTVKPCILPGCGEPTELSRCPEHRKDTRDKRARGYDWHWDQLSRRARRLQPFCTDCGSTEDLQGDHTPEAWRRHYAGRPIRLRDIAVVCGPCNRARGPARPGSPRDTQAGGGQPTASSPVGKAQSALHTRGGIE